MKNFILLLGSLCFYVWKTPLYILLLLLTILSDYVHGLMIEKYRGRHTAKILLVSALFFNLAILGFFGYADFFIELINAVFRTNLEKVGFPMPLGITVYTLQTMSYIIDLYFGRVKVQKNFLDYATYVSMFPQLSVGPIVCYHDIEEQIHRRRVIPEHISAGAVRFCFGLAKKVLIADSMLELWENVREAAIPSMSMATGWLGITAFAFYMYYTFSGYSDMAIGLGAVLGFSFPENFSHPFAADSVAEFLRRWNRTLVNWFKTYFYRPLTEKRDGLLIEVIGISALWSMIGLWYGPDITFLLWGAWFAIFFLLEKLVLRRVLEVLPFFVKWIYTMMVVSAGWLLFALDTIPEAWEYLLVVTGQGASGILDDRFFYLLLEFLPMLAVGILFSLPQPSAFWKKLGEGRNALSMAIYRFCEKTIPPVLLIMALLRIVSGF